LRRIAALSYDETPVPIATSTDPGPLDHALSQFVSVRPRLFGMAYRMLGSAADADDIVQSAWLRWQTTDRSEVQDPPAFLSTMTARLAMNHAASAHQRRQSYVGPWLPEPVDTSGDPYLGAERGDALELAVLVLLEKLSPKERGAYVLREAFDDPYDKIAEILGLEEANGIQRPVFPVALAPLVPLRKCLSQDLGLPGLKGRNTREGG
jgi:RNA polymerase sigma-70 factor (ECF subfamily)